MMGCLGSVAFLATGTLLQSLVYGTTRMRSSKRDFLDWVELRLLFVDVIIYCNLKSLELYKWIKFSVALSNLVLVICIDYLNWIFSVQCIEELNFMKNLLVNTCNLIDCEESTDRYWEVTNEVYGIFRFLLYWDGNQQW